MLVWMEFWAFGVVNWREKWDYYINDVILKRVQVDKKNNYSIYKRYINIWDSSLRSEWQIKNIISRNEEIWSFTNYVYKLWCDSEMNLEWRIDELKIPRQARNDSRT